MHGRLKYSRMSRQAISSRALPRWHSSTMTRSKKLGSKLPEQALPAFVFGQGLVEGEVHLPALGQLTVPTLWRASPKAAKMPSLGWSTRMLRSAR